MWILGSISGTSIDWFLRWAAPIASTVANFLKPLAGLLQEFFWWAAAQVLHLAALFLDTIGDKWPNLVFNIGDVVTWWNYGNHWLPMNEALGIFAAWLALVMAYFVVKVILKLF